MSLTVGVPKETFPNERRVALVPAIVSSLKEKGMGVLIESGAGESAGYPDADYEEKGAKIPASRENIFESSDVILQIRTPGANPEKGPEDYELLRPGQIIIGFAEPLTGLDVITELAQRHVVSFAIELIPRISRAQGMDALTSMATVSGYKSVLLAASAFGRMFPMMMTAAGTISPARVLVIGAGVAGLQAIATARQLGAVVAAYDIRPAAMAEAESLGAKFLGVPLEAESVQDARGYAREQSEEFHRRQQQILADAVAGNDVVITTAAVPGKMAPVLISEKMVASMNPGSVIVDLAAERGGNCVLTIPGDVVRHEGVSIHGPVNITSEVPHTASQLYAKNISNFLLNLCKNSEIELDTDDEIVRDTLVTRNGKIVHPRIREALGLSSVSGA